MATKVSAHQVGLYFVQQYYHVFQQQRDCVHQFYNESSAMVRVDGEISQSSTDLMKIHQELMALNFIAIEIKTINSLDSWNGGVLVVVSGAVQSRDFVGWRRFVQTFFLAPQGKGYVVLNDVFHFADEEAQHHPSAPLADEIPVVDYKGTVPTEFSAAAGGHQPDFASDEEAGEYGNSDHIVGENPAQEYSYEDHLQEDTDQEPDPELDLESAAKGLGEEKRFGDHNSLHQSAASHFYESQHAAEQPCREPEKLSYASILRAKGKAQPSSTYQQTFSQSTSFVSDWNATSEILPQQSNTSLPSSEVDVAEEVVPSQKGESLSVYVRNLPSSITTTDILQEFENFGKVKQDGIFLRNIMDTGVSYAFVEFESIRSVHDAIKASPIQLAGRKVYIEERRPNNSLSSRGGRNAGRGRGGRGGRSYGRST